MSNKRISFSDIYSRERIYGIEHTLLDEMDISIYIEVNEDDFLTKSHGFEGIDIIDRFSKEDLDRIYKKCFLNSTKSDSNRKVDNIFDYKIKSVKLYKITLIDYSIYTVKLIVEEKYFMA